ncbi:MAG: hypothetical protein K0R08_1284 [Solimicrobium sp.]|jgi:hypothetical protein|nr:hypothetical protein [Solimicrobium sp.]
MEVGYGTAITRLETLSELLTIFLAGVIVDNPNAKGL